MCVSVPPKASRKPRLELFGEGMGVHPDLALQLGELLGAGQFEGGRQRGEDVDVRPALLAGENRPVKLARQRFFGRQDAGAAVRTSSCAW